MTGWPSAADRAVGVAIVANLVGGTSYVLAKVALGGMPETTLVVVRTAIALVVLLPLAGAGTRALLRARGQDRRLLLVMGIVGYALPLVLGNHGLRRSTATNAALLIGTEPIAVVVLSALMLGERLSRARLVALGLGLAGATVLVAGGVPFLGVRYAPHVVGDLLLVAHGIAWGVYTVAGKRLLERHDALGVSAASLLVALPALAPLAAVEAAAFDWDPARLWPALGAAAALGLVVSAGMTLLWNTALRDLEASRLAGFIVLQPLAGLVLGVVALGEPLTAASLGGGLLILFGVWALVVEERGRHES
jgi:drug/metabolite transporter (DMT)-like permease